MVRYKHQNTMISKKIKYWVSNKRFPSAFLKLGVPFQIIVHTFHPLELYKTILHQEQDIIKVL